MIVRRLLITVRRVYYCPAVMSHVRARVGDVGWAHHAVQRFTRLLWLVAAALIVTVMFRPVPVRDITSNILFAIGFGCPLVLYLSSLPPAAELALTTVVGAAFAGLLSLLDSTFGAPQAIVGLGLGCRVMMAANAQRRTGVARLEAKLYLLPACVSLLFTLEAGVFFSVISSVMPVTHDGTVYKLDAAFGFPWSFAVGQLFERLSWLKWICFVLYVAPPPSLMFVYALQVRATKPPPIDVITVLFVAMVVGYSLYFLYPVAGPLASFGGAFPDRAPNLTTVSDRFVVLFTRLDGELAPRNAIPSLHLGSVIIALWHAWPYGRWARGVSLTFVAGTFLATMGLGEHYFIDLLMGLAFMLVIQAACLPNRAATRPARIRAFAVSGIVLLAWYGALAWLTPLRPPAAMMWLFAIATVVSVIRLERRLASAIESNRDQNERLVDAGVAPGPAGWPLVGSLFAYRRDVLGVLSDGHRRFGDVVRFRVGPMIVHLVAHPDHIQHVLVAGARTYDKDTRSSEKIRGMTGDGLLTMSGDRWLKQRRLMQPAFHAQQVQGYMTLMADSADGMIDRWRISSSDRPLDVASEMMRLTYEIVGRSLFGADLSHEVAAVEHAAATAMAHTYSRLERLVDVTNWRLTSRSREFAAAMKTIDDVVERVVRDRAQQAAQGTDLLSLLLAAQDDSDGQPARMSHAQLRNEIVTLLLAGHETTANALTWTWYLLSRHPHVRRELDEELSRVLGGQRPDMQTIRQLPFARAVIQESMRLYPPIWIMERRAVEADVIGGFYIPRGSSVVISPFVTHRHPDFWQAPERFEPRRFLGDGAKRAPFSYLPFGAGQRLCIGHDFAMLEATVILVRVAQRCELTSTGTTPILPLPGLTLRTRSGLPMTVRVTQ